MYSKTFIIIAISLFPLYWARGSIAIKTLKQTYPKSQIIEKTIQLNDEDLNFISQKNHLNLVQKKYTFFQIKKETSLKALAIIQTFKIRSKKASLLHIFQFKNNQLQLKNIEILSFREPREYQPKKSWLALFLDKNWSQLKESLQNKEIPIITGATLSSYSFFKASLTAAAIINLQRVRKK